MGLEVNQGVHSVLFVNCPQFKTDLIQHNRSGIFQVFKQI